ncbi:MAG TPA: T9SS type A sorting domain-containing protein, partial [Candidatus Kapabacteria bacterium]|nr:T9SS type A sorting domain-containing protein [Candidatus Kapabacteria bacterium]
ELVENGEYLLTNTKEITFGLSNTLSTVKNLQADFRFLVKDSTPIAAEVVVKVSFFDETVGYGPDVDFFTFVINPDYRDLNANNLVVTFDSKGGMGYSDPVEHTHGNGFTWEKAPSDIPSAGRSILYQSGLMLSADEERVVSIAPSQWTNYAKMDFKNVSRIDAVIPPDHARALQELRTVYEDTNTPDSLQVGVTVDQRSYAFGGAASDAIVVDYRIAKRPLDHPGLEHSDETTVALFMDWDIGPSGSSNITRFDKETETAYLWRHESTMPYIAVRIISELPDNTEKNFHAIQNNGEDGIVGTYQGFTDLEKWMAMTIQRDTAGLADVSQVFGLKNVQLAIKDSVRVTYVMGMGRDAASAKAAIDDAERQWFAPLSVSATPEAQAVQVYPNPFVDRISFALPAGTAATARLIDAMGRVVLDEQLAPNASSIEARDLPTGAYILELTQGGKIYRSQIVKIK